MCRKAMFSRRIAGTRLLLICWAAAWLCLSAVAFASPPITSYVDSMGRRVYSTSSQIRKSQPASFVRARTAIDIAGKKPIRTRAQLEQIIDDAAQENSLDPALVKIVVEVESAGNPRAVSRKGAMGLMQLMPSTAEKLNVIDAFDPQQNIRAGSQHLRGLIERFGGDLSLALAAYNAGEERVLRNWKVPNIPETIEYVGRILSRYRSREEHRFRNSVLIYRSETNGIIFYSKF